MRRVEERDRTPKPCLHPKANHQHGTCLAYDKDGCRCDPCYRARAHSRAIVKRTTFVRADRVRAHVRQLLTVLTLGQLEARSGVDRTSVRCLVGTLPGRAPSKRVTRATEAALLAVRPVHLGPEERSLVDGTGTRRRLCALVALGWTGCGLSARLGLSSFALWRVMHAESALVTTGTRAAAIRVYDEISMTVPPPTPGAKRAWSTARAYGWLPPLAWDDDTIDDPNARPSGATQDDTRDVDLVVVDRAVDGKLSHPLAAKERRLAVERLARQGFGNKEIGKRLHVTARTVSRDRHLDDRKVDAA